MPEILQNMSQNLGPEGRARALSRLAALVRTRAFFVALAVLAAGALSLGYYLHRFKDASLTVVNLRPCNTAFALHRPATDEQSLTEGWWTLEPGQKMTLERRFVDVAPAFAVYAESRCPELIRWVNELPDDAPATMYFEGGPGDTVSYLYVQPEATPGAQAEATPATQSEGSDKTRPDAERTIRWERGDGTTPPEGMDLVGFVRVPVSKSHEAVHLIIDHTFLGLYDEQGLPSSGDDEKIAAVSARAVLLATSLKRQQRFSENWPNPSRSFPYAFGLDIRDHNGMDMPGVLIEDVLLPKTINGDDVPFQDGDILTEFTGETIFSGLDLHMLLYEHATSLDKGIEVPVEFTVVRGDQKISGKTLYFFNPAYWGEQSALEAFGAGAVNTLAFGGGAAAEAVAKQAGRRLLGFVNRLAGSKDSGSEPPPEYKEERWKIAQRNARYKQLKAKAYEYGTFAGFVLPSAPRLLFQKALARNVARKGVPRLVANIAAATTLEVVEGVMWTVGDASPLRTPEQIADDIRKWTPYAVGVGVVSGAFTRRATRR